MIPKDDDLTYVQVTCLACAQAHLVNPNSGKVLGTADDEYTQGLCAFTRRARVRPKPRLNWLFLKSGAGVEILRFFEEEDPFRSGRARDARSLRLGHPRFPSASQRPLRS